MPTSQLLPLAACLAIAGLALAPAGCGQAGDGADQPGGAAAVPRPGLTTYSDHKRGYEVTFPSRWYRARENLTPALVDPSEILTIATFPLRLRRDERCYPPIDAPVPALDRLGPRDALVSIQERIQIERRVPDNRPRHFSLVPLDLHFNRERTCPDRTLGRASFMFFADQGRHFYAFVALGRAASARTRFEVRQALDSLVFDRQRRPYPEETSEPQHGNKRSNRRLRLTRTPYLGVSCPQPNRFACDRVGLTVWLSEPAEDIAATIAGRPIALSDKHAPARHGRIFEGFLRPAGLINGPLRVTPRPDTKRWEGNPPVHATVRIVATYPDGTTATKTLRLRLQAGYG